MRLRLALASILLCTAGTAAADTTPQTLPFSQDWTNVGLITANDDWSGVPGIVGYLGDIDNPDLPNDTDARTVVQPLSDVDVIANQTNTTISNGGVAEFELADAVVAFQGSGGADAPNIVLHLNTTGVANVRVEYDLVDIDAAAVDAAQQVALQYRLDTTSNFTNVAAGYIADASEGPDLSGKVTHVNVVIPEIANQAYVELRVITTNAGGSDEFIGVDNILIADASSAPTAVGASDPANEVAGGGVTLTATVTPGEFPASTAIAVVCDLSQIGGDATQTFADDGATGGDTTAADNIFTFATTIAATVASGTYALPCEVSDAEARSSDFEISVTVDPDCGNGVVDTGETCDDGDLDPGDGCSAACAEETGYDCTGSPSVCSDIDECTAMTDTCSDNAACTNTTGGFTCECDTGFTGDGMTCDPVCGDELVVTGEGCDDGGTDAGDGCDANCQVESGYECTGAPSACSTVCGDGLVRGDEGCDDDETTAGDGCDATCAVEEGWMCTGEPSTCSPTSSCGDGVVDAGEQCDDGNEAADDGCDAACTVETGWICDGADPTVCVQDSDGDLVPDDEDNCPALANPSQADDDDDGIGNPCDDDEPGAEDGGGGGCCSTSDDPRGVGGFALLGLLTVIGLRRRRRC